MTYAAALWLYAVLVFGIVAVPGMDMLFVLANTLTAGIRVGLAAVFGIMLGGAAHTAFGAVATTAILEIAPWLFRTMIVAGALYMGWIGLTLIRSTIVVGEVGGTRPRTPWQALRQGLVTCLMNPKAYLFTASVFPQFIKPQYGPVALQALALAAITVAMQFAIYGGLAFGARAGTSLLTGNPAFSIWAGRICGAAFLAVAAWSLSRVFAA